jgi:hypothetical protein
MPAGARAAAAAALLLIAAPRAGAACPVPAQDGGGSAAPAEESELDRLLRLAREASPVVRPQAARRLVDRGAEAAERVRAEAGGTPEGYAALGQDLLELLGELDDAELRADLWEAFGDRDFPWRPSVARTLAKTARGGEAERFRAALGDPVATVRAAALVGLATLDHRAALDAVRARLADPDDRVRREAAVLVDRWGDASTLWWLVEDLQRTDRFFDLDTGRLARFESLRRLAPRLDGDLGFAPERTPSDPDNAAALERIAARVTELAGEPPELPRVARAGGADVAAVLGLEVRSCRRGEHYLRWGADGTLWVGTGNATRIALDAATGAALTREAGAALRAVGEQDFWGEPGCDVEVYYVAAADGDVRALRVSKGPGRVAGLRPEPLGELSRALLASLPAAAGDLRAEVAGALAAVGGELAR